LAHSRTQPPIRFWLLVFSLAAALFCAGLSAQQAGSRLEGALVDVQGKAVANALVTVKNQSSGAVRTTRSDANGAYSIDGLTDGKYTIDASATGFASATQTVELAAGQTRQVGLKLGISSVAEQITVNAGIDSIAAESAPSGGYIEERSAQSLVSNNYIENFTSPIADFGEIVQIVPGTFTTSTNGVGLGQSKTYFRGFQDGDYNIDFDGIPFYDTNSPTHHSWAFFPSQWIGGVDFDRSPGTASTIGPTPFGGSIHLLSKPLTGEQDIRGGVSYSSWNTKLYDGAYNSGSFGLFGSPRKSNLFIDVHHMTSDGYQSFNFNLRNAGSLLYQYQFSPRTVLTGFAGVVQLNSNGPNIASTRCMLYGSSPSNAYSCAATVTVSGTAVPVTANGLQPFTGAGPKFLLTNNSDPVSWFDFQYNTYQVPTDFEYVSLKTELGKSWLLEVKPYTYNYDNGELYSNVTPMTEVTNAAAAANPSLVPGSIVVAGKAYYDGVAIAPCDVQVVKKGVAALPCAIDKYNSYRKYGETAQVSQTSRFGTLRAGMWYEWADTNRHQYPSDPLNNWADQPLPKFNESFWTNSYQPFAEYEFHVTPKFNITAGTKFAAYTIDVLHHADDGSTVGELACTSNTAACPATITNTGSFTAWLPSIDFNYRVMPNWAIYAQAATGSIVPPSAVYDYNQTAASASAAVPQLATPPKQQKSTTYQIGTVYKGQRLTIDADGYRIRFQNSYSSTVDNIPGDVDAGDTIFYLQPSSITQGVEFETTAVLAHGLNLYLNATAANAYYAGDLNAGTQAAPYLQQAPEGLWVASTPTDTEQQGLTYQSRGLDLGIFNHRVGEERLDNGQYHNQGIIPTFSTVNTYVNYTLRNRSIFDGTKIRLDATNLLDSHNVQSLTLAGSPATLPIPGTTYTNQFNTSGPTAINGADAPGLMAGRSFAVTVTFGFAPRER
jgi:iron complex outermembrane recepter protein